MATRSTMPLDSAPAGPAKATNCHRFAGFVPARFPLDEKWIAQRVIVVAQRAVRAARPDGVLRDVPPLSAENLDLNVSHRDEGVRATTLGGKDSAPHEAVAPPAINALNGVGNREQPRRSAVGYERRSAKIIRQRGAMGHPALRSVNDESGRRRSHAPECELVGMNTAHVAPGKDPAEAEFKGLPRCRKANQIPTTPADGSGRHERCVRDDHSPLFEHGVDPHCPPKDVQADIDESVHGATTVATTLARTAHHAGVAAPWGSVSLEPRRHTG
jgi:hypothetical protein